MSMAPSRPALQGPLAEARTAPTHELVGRMRQMVVRDARRWRWLVALEATGLLLSAPVGFLLLFLFLDSQWPLPVLARSAVGVGFLACVLWLALRTVRRWRALDLSEDQVAL